MLSADIKDALLKTKINHYLSSKEIDFILNHSEIKVFKPNEILVHQGKKSKGIFIVIDGYITVCSKLLGEGDICWTRLHCGNYFGEISIIAKQPCIASFIAEIETKCIFIKKNFFNNLGLFFPKIKYQILRAICDDMYSRYQQLHASIIKSVERTEMKTQSLFSEFIESLLKPTEITFDQNKVFKDLAKSEPFQVFTEAEIKELINYMTCIKIPRNCTIINADESNTGCYLVLHGAVQANIVHRGKIVKISVLGPLKLFNPLSIINRGSPSQLTYIACERAILLHINEKDLLHIQEKHPGIWQKFFEFVSVTFALLERATNELDLRLRTEFYNR